MLPGNRGPVPDSRMVKGVKQAIAKNIKMHQKMKNSFAAQHKSIDMGHEMNPYSAKEIPQHLMESGRTKFQQQLYYQTAEQSPKPRNINKLKYETSDPI